MLSGASPFPPIPMAKPTLKAHQTGLRIAKQALSQAGWTQKDLSAQVPCSRQPITNFFKGEAVAQPIFIGICDRLDLNWQQIADLSVDLAVDLAVETEVRSGLGASPARLSGSSLAAGGSNPLDSLVQTLRQEMYDSIQERCGTIRILDMSHPVDVKDLYIDVNILEQITGRRHKRIEEFLQECELENFDRFGFGNIVEERIAGIKAVEKYKKLILLGKPGAGKTTFLKHLAIQCNEGRFEQDRVPIFITLKDFAEVENKPNLLEYISQKDLHRYIPTASVTIQDDLTDCFLQVFEAGEALILLDGLDEVKSEDYERVVKEISDFSERFWKNHFILTCRIAAWDYTFEKFTEVEVADFDEQQIARFATKWFEPQKTVSAKAFLAYLDRNPRIKQLAVSPLLLTLVCLAFEESGDCPSTRSELYKEGIDALLKKWDAKRGIQRDQIYKRLSHHRKEDLLSYIAFETFKEKDYFIKQRVIESYIQDYIRKLPHANTEPEELQLDSEAILYSIEAQHGLLVERAKGIYSFSHLSFHEYFAAREIICNSQSLEATLTIELLPHLFDKRWREVFLLSTEMLLRKVSLLLNLMQEKIDQLIEGADRLKQFLNFVGICASAPEFGFCNAAALRGFFFDIDFDIDENRTVALLLDRSSNLLICASFLTRILDDMTLTEAVKIAQTHDATATDPSTRITAATSANAVMKISIELALNLDALESNRREFLSRLLQRCQGQSISDEELKEVADKAREFAKKRHHIGGQWQFDPEEKALLRQYYYATRLLVECMHSDGCMMLPEKRQAIEQRLFMPPPAHPSL